MKRSSSRGQVQSWDLSPRDALLPLLRPGETLGLALSGAAGWLQGLSFPELFLALGGILGGVHTSALDRTTFIGLTGEDLVFAITRDPHKPSRLQRAPLDRVAVLKFKESRTPLLIDVLVIRAGAQKLTLSTSPGLRPVVHQLIDTLAARGPARDLPAPPLPARLALRLKSSVIDGDIAATLRESGPANASLRASRYSLMLLAPALAAGILLFFGLLALPFLFPGGLYGRSGDNLLFILLLPLLLAVLLGSLAALAAAALAIYSIFKRRERALTIIAALLAAAALSFIYYVFAAALLTA